MSNGKRPRKKEKRIENIGMKSGKRQKKSEERRQGALTKNGELCQTNLGP